MLLDILAQLKEAKDLILSKAPDVLVRTAEIAEKIAEVARKAADFLNNFDPNAPHPITAMPEDARKAAIEEFHAFDEEIKDLAGKKPYHAAKDAEEGSVPPGMIVASAKMLSSLTSRIVDKLEDH